MSAQSRKTGINFVSEMSWGTHFCYFYETTSDFFDILIPYFKTGLENNEFCLWVIPNPSIREEAFNALRQAVPNLDEYLEKGSIEIFSHCDWYLKEDIFDLHSVINNWKKKLKQALGKGYVGMRASGNTFWVEEKDSTACHEYELELNRVIAGQRMVVVCTYPLAKNKDEILDVTRTHQFSIARKSGYWELLESPELRHAREEISIVNKELGAQLIEQTKKIAKTSKELKKEAIGHQRSEKDLVKQKEILQTVFDNIPLMINCIGKDGQIKLINREWERVLGWSLEEVQVQGFDLISKLYPDPQYQCQVRDFVTKANGKWTNFKTTIKNGSIVDTSWIGVNLLDRTFLGIGQDVTERKRVEERLQEQAALLDIAQDAIIVCDMQQQIFFWNKSAVRIYGWTAKEAIGKNVNQLLYKKDSGTDEHLKYSTKNGNWNGELEQITKENNTVTVASRVTLVLDYQGNPKSILIVSTDITNKKLLENQSLRTQRLESLGTLASGIAHDLNNILTPILLSIELMRKAVLDEEKSHHLFDLLEITTKRGVELIKQVLAFGRGLEGKPVVIQTKHIILEIGKMIREIFPKSIEIKINVQTGLDAILGDATQLHQVLMNLCVNARDAMPTGGTLTISAKNFFIDETYAIAHTEAKVGPYIIISVLDEGFGISSEIIDKIFDPFFTTKEIGNGSGLGLSTVLGIAKNHGGFINVCSEVGTGSEFKVYLPVAKMVENNPVKQHKEQPLIGHEGVILVIDDESAIREITKLTLEAAGYTVLVAGDGIAAIALYLQNQNVLKTVLVDMMMPIIDGPSTIKILQGLNPQINIIAMSGLATKAKIAEVFLLGVKTFLTKPFTSEELLRALNCVLNDKIEC